MVVERLGGLQWHRGALVACLGLLCSCTSTTAVQPETPKEISYRRLDAVLKWPLPIFGVSYTDDEGDYEELVDWEYYREWGERPPPDVNFDEEFVVFGGWPATFGPKPRLSRVLQSADTLIVEATMILPRDDCWRPVDQIENIRHGSAKPTWFVLAVARPDRDWRPDSIGLSVKKRQAAECD